ncbi:enoyl-CoA hydratase [Aeromicrobium piscarium]|uniref:Enoyl-CoA hydratase n=1 Tax=Aeromicrobium piscarium TaxID=2590901 RepID=A0A554S7I9_9ACTN|nr:enoyl-CoA hydratase [Aeromicrobium piscarium]TSD62309.1 enoyl-CoA hydratase [Aeromicrobium piscarium]
MSDHLLFNREGSILAITLNRPEKHNALSPEMSEALVAACRGANDDPDLRAVIFRGAGDKAFAAGADIGRMEEWGGGPAGIAYEREVSEFLSAIEMVKVPTIAAVNGYCVGGGIEIAAACDLRIATPSARFGTPMARKLGNCLSMHAIALLVSHLGQSRASDMLLRARLIGADEAFAAGFVSEICSADELDDRAMTIAREVAANAPLTLQCFKESMRRLRVRDLPDIDDLIAMVYGSEDFREGVSSFLEGRPAQWTGR